MKPKQIVKILREIHPEYYFMNRSQYGILPNLKNGFEPNSDYGILIKFLEEICEKSIEKIIEQSQELINYTGSKFITLLYMSHIFSMEKWRLGTDSARLEFGDLMNLLKSNVEKLKLFMNRLSIRELNSLIMENDGFRILIGEIKSQAQKEEFVRNYWSSVFESYPLFYFHLYFCEQVKNKFHKN